MSKEYTYTQKISENGEVELEVQVQKDLFEETKKSEYKRLSKNVKLKGFRSGKAPKHMVESYLGAELFESTINKMIPQVTSEIMAELKLRPITRVDYEIGKIEDDLNINYKAKFTVFPDLKLDNFDKINVKKEEVKIEDKDIKAVIDNMLEDSNKNAESMSEQDDKNSKKFEKANDEWVKSLAMENIKSIEELKKQIELTLKSQREVLAEEKYNADIIKDAIKIANFQISESLIDTEVHAKEHDYIHRIEDLGLKVDDFLRQQKTTMDDLKKQWRSEIEESLKADLLIMKIAEEKKLFPSNEDITKEIESIDDMKLKQQYNTPEGKQRIQLILTRQRAFKWLKDQIK